MGHVDVPQQRKVLELEEQLSRLKSDEDSATPRGGDGISTTSAIPEVIPNETGTMLSNTMPSEYLQDTFESSEPTTTSHKAARSDLPSPSKPTTSTPVTASGTTRTERVESDSGHGRLQLNGVAGDDDVTLSEGVSGKGLL